MEEAIGAGWSEGGGGVDCACQYFEPISPVLVVRLLRQLNNFALISNCLDGMINKHNVTYYIEHRISWSTTEYLCPHYSANPDTTFVTAYALTGETSGDELIFSRPLSATLGRRLFATSPYTIEAI